MSSKWVRLKKFLEDTGETKDSVRNKIRNGSWVEGVIWKKAEDGKLRICPAEVDRWIENGCQRASQSGRTSIPRA